MASEAHFDLIIIGTGAGGGTLLHRLAPTGKKILVIERGDFLKREQENWSSKEVFVNARYTTPEKWLDKDGKAFRPGMHYYVGGNTKFFGAALFRFREKDFGEVLHAGGVSPAWPIEYADLAPYYLRAEQLYSVHGERGSDPTEPPEASPYPFPAISHEPRIQEIHDELVKMGRQPFHLPVGVRLNEADPLASDCIRCQTCDGFACVVDAKADADVTCVRPALNAQNVTLLTNSFVTRLLTSPSGTTVTGVAVASGESEVVYSADVVVVSCGAINSAALLLRSASEQHPRGLANSSDQVGRNYMCHNNSALLALSRKPNPTRFQKTLALNDFYFGSSDWEFPLGHIQMLGKSDATQLSGDAPKFAPHLALEEIASHSLDFWLTSEDLPHPDNRVTLGPNNQIQLSYTPNNTEGHARLIAKLKDMVGHFGGDTLVDRSVYLGKTIPIAGCAHQNGTCRMGTDPSDSVVNAHCRTHDVDNLYIVDGSFFCSSTAVNPALTIMANALRVGDHLAERLG